MIVQETIDALLEAASSRKAERSLRRGRARWRLRSGPDEGEDESAGDGAEAPERTSRAGSYVEPQSSS
ncbi:hypothetical protein FGB62_23g225 [Gracilaria domingensis]|nr:hypothetical protein FGB62_23g225 [Gracilaria domingensis]